MPALTLSLDLDRLREHFVLANVPEYLYRALTGDPGLQYISQAYPLEQLWSAFEDSLKQAASTEEDEIRAYALLITLLMRSDSSHLRFDELVFPSQLSWMRRLVELHRIRIGHSSTSVNAPTRLANALGHSGVATNTLFLPRTR
jgi:hypothetical protein